jgi:hypothetical protein
VTLNGGAPASGAFVTLTAVGSEARNLIIPSTVAIGTGNTSATFPVQVSSSGVSEPAEVTVNATYNGVTRSFLVRLAPLP